MIINSGTLAELSDADRAALEQAALEFEAQRWETAEADQGAFEQKLADNGAKIVSLSDAELAATAEHVRAQVWPQVLTDVGQEWGQSILDKIGN
jgi:TRAP-type C4-dicarboxylate transport system substrate-binding protein